MQQYLLYSERKTGYFGAVTSLIFILFMALEHREKTEDIYLYFMTKPPLPLPRTPPNTNLFQLPWQTTLIFNCSFIDESPSSDRSGAMCGCVGSECVTLLTGTGCNWNTTNKPSSTLDGDQPSTTTTHINFTRQCALRHISSKFCGQI